MDSLLNRYNLKRKVAELNPVTLEDFNGRMAKHEAQVKALSGEMKQPTGYCVSCCKNFGTQKALENHKQSKKHMVRIQFRPVSWPSGPGIDFINSFAPYAQLLRSFLLAQNLGVGAGPKCIELSLCAQLL